MEVIYQRGGFAIADAFCNLFYENFVCYCFYCLSLHGLLVVVIFLFLLMWARYGRQVLLDGAR